MQNDLFDNLAEAREQDAWLVTYSRDGKEDDRVIVFADSENEAAEEFDRLTGDHMRHSDPSTEIKNVYQY